MAWSKPLSAAGILQNLKEKLARLQQQWRSTRQENERLHKENEELRKREKQLEREGEQLRQEQGQLRREQDRLQQERERLRQENERLKRQLEEAQRANKRQAAPFSRGRQKQNPKPPGRKSGVAYGRRYRKNPPLQVDEVISVPYRHTAPAGVPWKWRRLRASISRRWCARPSGGALILRLATAACAIDECQGAMRARLPTPWEP